MRLGVVLAGITWRRPTPASGPRPAQRRLLIVTHVDADHIDGVPKRLVDADPPSPIDVRGIWFNSRDHLDGETVPRPEPADLEHYGARQGNALSKWLLGRSWNEVSQRRPFVRTDPLTTLDLDNGMRVVVIGPSMDRLAGLADDWDDEMRKVEARRAGGGEVGPEVEAYGPEPPPDPPVLQDADDLDRVACERPGDDPKAANGSSISVVLEWEGRRVLLIGDAWPSDLCEGLAAYECPRSAELDRSMADRPAGVVPFDVVKVPHHGSAGNVTDAWLDLVTVRRGSSARTAPGTNTRTQQRSPASFTTHVRPGATWSSTSPPLQPLVVRQRRVEAGLPLHHRDRDRRRGLRRDPGAGTLTFGVGWGDGVARPAPLAAPGGSVKTFVMVIALVASTVVLAASPVTAASERPAAQVSDAEDSDQPSEGDTVTPAPPPPTSRGGSPPGPLGGAASVFIVGVATTLRSTARH